MNRYLSITLIFLLLSCVVCCQSITVRAGIQPPSTESHGYLPGLGAVLHLSKSTAPYSVSLFFDGWRSKNELDNCTICLTPAALTNQSSYSVGATFGKRIAVREKSFLVLGPSVGLVTIESTRQGVFANWIETTKARKAEVGMSLRFVRRNIIKQGVDFELALTPNYHLSLGDDEISTGSTPWVSNDYWNAGLYVGVSFRLD